MSSSGPVRTSYHHGDLRNALVEAAADLARTGGPQAVTIRAAARQVGVTPTAAYRHFAGHQELLHAAKEEALRRMAQSMRAELSKRPEPDDPVVAALGRLAAIGRGYVAFATSQPGLFSTCAEGNALSEPGEMSDAAPFQLLVDVLDDLVKVGYLPPERRPLAEFAAWSLVHGMAMLFVDGPLREAGDELLQESLARAMVVFAEGLGGDRLPADLHAMVTEAARP
ncbi:TetR/AcrR family transcriptional regulator [Prauserella oleivorans]|uniref:TetR/AcrR family transcriptional regulator n=1 Tax=Prauserella oleivorans TaxID=1478153 RepID=A0ABW5WBR0_9PSEU